MFVLLTCAPACVHMSSSLAVMPASQTCCLIQKIVIWAVWSVWNVAAPTLWPMDAGLTARLPRGWPSASITLKASNAVMWPDIWARSELTHSELRLDMMIRLKNQTINDNHNNKELVGTSIFYS